MVRKYFSGAAIAACIFTFVLAFAIGASAQGKSALYETVFSRVLGDDLRYENFDLTEIERVGPAAFDVTADGDFVIVDTPRNRLLVFSPNGEKLRQIVVADAVGITDVEIVDDVILVLDSSAVEPAVFRISLDGVVLEKLVVDTKIVEAGLTGIAVEDDGSLLFEVQSGREFRGVDGSIASNRNRSVASTDIKNLSPTTASVKVANTDLPDVRVENTLVAIQPLAISKNGDSFIIVTELSSTPQIHVDQTVRRYSANGRLLGIARVPVDEAFTFVQNNIRLVGNNVLVLLPRKDSVDVVKLNFGKRLESILPKAQDEQKDEMDVETASATCSITRDQIAANAAPYISNRVSLSTTNISGTCSGRTKPRYLGTSGTYSSVPYDWGGNDSVSGFNAYMANGYQAGDIPIYSTGTESCSRGVDCSGFVGRTFGLSTKYSTSTLPNISTAIAQGLLQRGDIINRSGDHVVLFDSLASNGVWAWESTVNGNVDRVVRSLSSWTRFNGYTPRRYSNVCHNTTFSVETSPSTVTLYRGSTAYFDIYAYTNSGFRGSVNWYAKNLPGNRVLAGTGFFPASVNVTSNYSWNGSQFRLVTDQYTPRGTFSIWIEGRYGIDGTSGSSKFGRYITVKIL